MAGKRPGPLTVLRVNSSFRLPDGTFVAEPPADGSDVSVGMAVALFDVAAGKSGDGSVVGFEGGDPVVSVDSRGMSVEHRVYTGLRYSGNRLYVFGKCLCEAFLDGEDAVERHRRDYAAG